MTGKAAIQIVPFQKEHLGRIKLREVHNINRIVEVKTQALTFMRDGDPIAIVGFVQLSPGILTVWGLFSDLIKEIPLSFHRSVKLLIEHAFDSYSLRRMQMSVRVGFTEGWSWAQALGFVCEGVMSNYEPDGSSAWLFARVSQ